MGAFELTLKHAGKSYALPDFDPSAPAAVFKDQIYRLTGVPADKVKVPVKGGMLKDDADLNKLGFKPGQTVMVSRPRAMADMHPGVFTDEPPLRHCRLSVRLGPSRKRPLNRSSLWRTCPRSSLLNL